MMTLSPSGFLSIGAVDLEYRMIGPLPAEAPTIVMLHEGLGSAALWGDFPEKLQTATGAGVFVYSRAGYGTSSPIKLPRPLDYMHIEALEVLPKLLDGVGYRRGLLLGHSDGASIAAIYAGAHQDHRVQGLALIAPQAPHLRAPSDRFQEPACIGEMLVGAAGDEHRHGARVPPRLFLVALRVGRERPAQDGQARKHRGGNQREEPRVKFPASHGGLRPLRDLSPQV